MPAVYCLLALHICLGNITSRRSLFTVCSQPYCEISSTLKWSLLTRMNQLWSAATAVYLHEWLPFLISLSHTPFFLFFSNPLIVSNFVCPHLTMMTKGSCWRIASVRNIFILPQGIMMQINNFFTPLEFLENYGNYTVHILLNLMEYTAVLVSVQKKNDKYWTRINISIFKCANHYPTADNSQRDAVKHYNRKQCPYR